MTWPVYITIWIAGLIGTVLALVDDTGAKIGAAAALFGVYLLVLLAGTLFPQLGLYFSVSKRGSHEEGRVALTFEDGPDPSLTPRLLDLLKQENIPAAFFSVGARVVAYPELILREDKEGHLLGNHTYRHHWHWRWWTRSGLRAELERTDAAFARAIQRRPRFIRLPPGLAYPGVGRVLREANLTGVGWDVGIGSARSETPQAAAARVARLARNGSLIALRDSPARGTTPDAVVETTRQIIVLLKERGFKFVRLDQMLGLPGDEPV
jgi:peptidoglycan-N-acetylglucosamine deacetylase